MEIEKLYEEMGRELSRYTVLTNLEQAEQKDHQARRQMIQEKLTSSRERLLELQEAVRKVTEEGIEPLVAKITAKEDLSSKLQGIQVLHIYNKNQVPDLSDRAKENGGKPPIYGIESAADGAA
jgi:hypothetical protein